MSNPRAFLQRSVYYADNQQKRPDREGPGYHRHFFRPLSGVRTDGRHLLRAQPGAYVLHARGQRAAVRAGIPADAGQGAKARGDVPPGRAAMRCLVRHRHALGHGAGLSCNGPRRRSGGGSGRL